MFGRIMSWPDSLIIPGMELCTALFMNEVTKAKSSLESGANPRDEKLHLAEAVVSIYHGQEGAGKARENCLATFADGKLPEKLQEFRATTGTELSECFIRAGLVKSRAEWRRLIAAGAVSDAESGKKVTEPARVSRNQVFKAGKRRFLRVGVDA
jgi:tyrosyl-tRNA synthetase